MAIFKFKTRYFWIVLAIAFIDLTALAWLAWDFFTTVIILATYFFSFLEAIWYLISGLLLLHCDVMRLYSTVENFSLFRRFCCTPLLVLRLWFTLCVELRWCFHRLFWSGRSISACLLLCIAEFVDDALHSCSLYLTSFISFYGSLLPLCGMFKCCVSVRMHFFGHSNQGYSIPTYSSKCWKNNPTFTLNDALIRK